MKREKSQNRKVGIVLREDLLQRVDEFADRNYLSRSGLISIALNQYLNAQEVIILMRKLASLMQNIADNNLTDDEMLKQLEDIKKMSDLLSFGLIDNH